MARSAILTPYALSTPERVGRRRYWKQVLPVTSINYEGKKVDFDPAFHMDLADAFKKGAFDQVPLVFADSANGHNMDPRNFAGDIIDMEYRGPAKNQGTWALIEADKEGDKVIRRNPKLGVSARIKQGIEKADGRFFKRAVNHVLLTMNPRVSGMSPWQTADLSEDADIEVVDLTAAEYTEGTTMGKTATKGRRQQSESQIDLSALSDEEFDDLLLDLSTEVKERGLETDEDEGDEDEDTEPRPKRRSSRVKVTKTTERDELVDGDDDDQDGDDGEGGNDADLSDEDAERVMHREEVSQFGQMRIDLAKRDWNTKKDAYLRDGVPPFLLDLAEPVLSQPDAFTIDLADSDEDEIDVSVVLTKMLDGVAKIVDLGEEIGSAIDLSADESTKADADALLDEWNTTYPA